MEKENKPNDVNVENNLEIGEIISLAWKDATTNVVFFLGFFAIMFGLSIAFGFGQLLLFPLMLIPILGNIIIYAVQMLFSSFFEIGTKKILLDIADEKKPEYESLFDKKNFDILLNYVGASLLYGLIVFGGVLLLIIPGIIWGIQFSLVTYLVIEEKLGPIEALKRSSVLTKGHKGDLFTMNLALFGINILGFFALFIGLLWTIPTSYMAQTYAYRKLRSFQLNEKALEDNSTKQSIEKETVPKPPVPPRNSK